MSLLEAKIESLIFCSPKPINVSDIIKAFSESENKNFTEEEINNSINNLKEKYNKEEFSFEIIESGGGYQFLTKNDFSRLNEILLKQQSRRRLSISALETLSIIAYKQPVTKSEIEKIINFYQTNINLSNLNYQIDYKDLFGKHYLQTNLLYEVKYYYLH